MKRLLTSTFVFGLGGILNRLMSFFLLPLFTRFLSPTDYGITAMLAILSTTLQSVFALGQGTSISLCYFDKQYRSQNVIGHAWVILFLSGLLMLGIGYLTLDWVNTLFFGKIDTRYLIVLTYISCFFTLVNIPSGLHFQLANMTTTYVIITLLNSLVSIGLSIYLVAILKTGVTGYIQAYCVGQIFAFIVNHSVIAYQRFFQLDFNLPLVKELIVLGFPQIFAVWGMFVLLQGQKFHLQYLYSLALLGLFSMGYNLSGFINLAVNAFSFAWTPFIWTEEGDKHIIFGKIATYYFYFFGALATLIGIYARPVVMIMMSEDFARVYQFVGICAFGQLLYGFYSIVSTESLLNKDTVGLSGVQLLAAVLSLLSNTLCIYFFGAIGAALAFVLGFLLLLILQHRYNLFKGYTGIQFHYLRLLKLTMLFLLFLGLSMWPRNWVLWKELLYDTLTALGLFLSLWFGLSPQEKSAFFNYLTLFKKKFSHEKAL